VGVDGSSSPEVAFTAIENPKGHHRGPEVFITKEDVFFIIERRLEKFMVLEVQSSRSNNLNHRAAGVAMSSLPSCFCSLPMKHVQTRKPGPNTGRWFFGVG
jgi:hypothetical protein